MLDVSHLNAEQRRAVLHRGGPLLVLAGAGTGKTRVITYRMAALVDEGEAPESILALTFTQKAAGEMRERVGHLVGKKVAKRLVVGTFHAFGVKLLRADVHRIGLTNAFTILDEGDQRAQVRRLLREARIDEKRAPAPDVIAAISLLKNQGATRTDMLRTDAGRAAVEILPAYEKHLRALGAVDFDDLILMPITLLNDVPDVAARVQNRFRHVLVDEFQDTSAAQMAFLQGVTKRSRTVCAVGDDDQAIYGWRGAVVEHILKFEKYFPGAEAVALEDNYRSTPDILASANSVIARNTQRRLKRLRTSQPKSEPVRILVCNDEEAEVRSVVMEIAVGLKDGKAPERYAILFRTGTQSRPFETALRVEGIPYVLVGGPDIVDRREVKDTLAYASLLAGRDDEVAFRRAMATPARGVGAASVEKIVAHARQHGLSLVDAAANAEKIAGLQRKTAQSIAALGAILVKARDAQKAAPLADDPSERLNALLEEVGYFEMIDSNEDLVKASRSRAVVDLVLKSLSKLAQRTEESSQMASEVQSHVVLDEGSPLDQLIDRMALDRSDDKKDDGVDNRKGVRLMTLHASKGLEFPVVFLPGWEEGLMPHRRSLEDAVVSAPVEEDAAGDDEESLPPAPDMAVHVAAHAPGVEEERRLAYVGITRAREQLFITRAAARRKHGKLAPRIASRFLGELPADVVIEDRTERAMTPDEQRAHAADMFKKLREQLGGGA